MFRFQKYFRLRNRIGDFDSKYRSNAILCQKTDHNIGFQEKRQLFRGKMKNGQHCQKL
jgi:hypothetical protein